MKQVAQIQFDQKVMEKDKQMEMSRIEDLTKLARLKAQADADYYTAQKMSDANKVLSSVTQATHSLVTHSLTHYTC